MDNHLGGLEPAGEAGKLNFGHARLTQALCHLRRAVPGLQPFGNTLQLMRIKARSRLAGKAVAGVIIVVAREADSGDPLGSAFERSRRCHRRR